MGLLEARGAYDLEIADFDDIDVLHLNCFWCRGTGYASDDNLDDECPWCDCGGIVVPYSTEAHLAFLDQGHELGPRDS